MKNFTFYIEHVIEAEDIQKALNEFQEYLDAGNLDCNKTEDWLLEKQEVLPPKNSPCIIDLSKIDWPLLRIQKAFCLGALEEKDIHETEREMFQGIVHCFDYIQDCAAIMLGEKYVFGELKEHNELKERKESNPLINPLNHCLTILIYIQNGFSEKKFHRPIEEVIEEAKKAIDPFIHG